MGDVVFVPVTRTPLPPQRERERESTHTQTGVRGVTQREIHANQGGDVMQKYYTQCVFDVRQC